MEATFWDHVEELRKVFIRSLLVIGLGIMAALFFYQEIFGVLTSPLQARQAVQRNEIRYERIYNPSSYDIPYQLASNERNSNSESLILDSAVQDDKAMQDFESESLLMRGDHSQKVKAPRIKGGYGSKNCVALSSSTAESRLITIPAKNSILIEKTITSSPLLVLGPIEGMLTTFKMAFWIGLVATSPFWMYFLFSFIAPALEPYQKTMILPFISLSIVFILAGILFSFYITIPFANQYLQLFNESIGTNLWTLSNYLDYTVILLLANGLAFEFAVILFFMVHYRVLRPESMTKKRRHMIVAAFVIGALLTPPDVLTQILMAIPLIILYEIIILYGYARDQISRRKILANSCSKI